MVHNFLEVTERSNSMKPNILFIMTDQHVWHGIGKIGGWIRTENLDKLYDEGVIFERCYTNSPLCLPARASLATGLYPQALGINNNSDEGLDFKSKTWMQVLRRDGYDTSAFGKLHLNKWSQDLRGDLDKIKAYGFNTVDEIPGPRTYGKIKSNYYDYLKNHNLLETYNRDIDRRYNTKVYDSSPTPLPLRHYPDIYVADKAVEYLSQYSDVKPWFCMVSFGGPHEPWDAPIEYLKRYKPSDMPKPLKKPIDIYPDRARGVYDELLNGKYDFALNLSIKSMDEQDIANLRANYAAKVTLIDEQIGRIIDTVKQRGEYDNTIIVFTSDHGEQNGDYGLLFKQTFLESSVRVPLLIKPANNDYIHNRHINLPVELIDIGPTIVEMAGSRIDYNQSGISLLPVMKGEKDFHRAVIVSQLYNETMIIKDDIKYVTNKEGEIYMIFNLINDPNEEQNYATSYNYNAMTIEK